MPSCPADLKQGKPLSSEEEAAVARGMEWMTNGKGYGEEHRTRPATISFALASSPVALLSWIGEKFLEWTDDDPEIDEILTSLTLWWLTDTFPSSIYQYRDVRNYFVFDIII